MTYLFVCAESDTNNLGVSLSCSTLWASFTYLRMGPSHLYSKLEDRSHILHHWLSAVLPLLILTCLFWPPLILETKQLYSFSVASLPILQTWDYFACIHFYCFFMMTKGLPLNHSSTKEKPVVYFLLMSLNHYHSLMLIRIYSPLLLYLVLYYLCSTSYHQTIHFSLVLNLNYHLLSSS